MNEIEIRYRRLPDREQLFRQIVVEDAGDYVVTLLEAAVLTKPVTAGGGPGPGPGAPPGWGTHPGRRAGAGRPPPAPAPPPPGYAHTPTPRGRGGGRRGGPR